MSCLACKNKTSIDRCESKALTKLAYCGRHMRCKKPNAWIASRPSLLRLLIKFQAHCRGFITRLPLRNAGIGVLRRSLCHNDDEIITMEGKNEVHPHDYFSVEEDGKIWWFDQRSMIQWSQKELDIRNPYTRTILTRDDTRRLRKLWIYRRKRGLPIYHEGQQTGMTVIERRDNRWMRIAQILRENEYDIHHEHFISLDYPHLMMIVNTLTEDTRWWYTHTSDPTVHKYHNWLKNMRNVMHTYESMTLLSSDIAGMFLSALFDVHAPGELAYYIMTAYNRASAVILPEFD